MSAKSVKASVLKDIIEYVYVSTSFEVAIEIVKEHLEASDIKESECRVILIKATQCAPSLEDLQKYLTNSWFKFEGLGI